MTALLVSRVISLALLQVPVPAGVQSVVCARQGAEYRAELEGTLVLHAALLGPADERDARLQDAVRHQVRYVWGYLRNHPERKQEVKSALSAELPDVEILSVKPVTYGRDLVLDWNHAEPHLQMEEPYLQRAVKAGRVRRGDAAWVVHYRARFNLALCGEPREAESILRVPLPRDPYLFYWHVPARDRRILRYGKSEALTNPCSDDDFADLPHPIYYWYDWRIERSGKDPRGRAYNCHRLLKPGVDHVLHDVKLHRTGDASTRYADLASLWPGTEPLRVTVIIGVADNLLTTAEVKPLEAVLNRPGHVVDLARAALGGDAVEETGAREVLDFLVRAHAVAPLGAHRVTTSGAGLQVDVDARLARSGRAVRLRVHHGFTNVFGAVPPQHWAVARDALAHDHVVLYVGHSGIGENLRLQNMDARLGLPPGTVARETAGAPYQWVGFLSCFSYMYFGTDLAAAGGRGRQFVYSGTGYSDGEYGSVGVMDLVDQVLAGKVTGVDSYFSADDFLLFKSVPAH